MPLSDAEVERYARQVIIPGLGTDGQARMLASRVLVVGGEPGRRQAVRYLHAAGLQTSDGASPSSQPSDDTFDCIVVAGRGALAPAELRGLMRLGPPVVWYCIGNGRIHAGACKGGDALPEQLQHAPAAATTATWDSVLDEVAACDAAAAAIAIVLGWHSGSYRYEVDLA